MSFLVGGDHIAAAFRGFPHRGNQAHSRVKVLGQHLLQRFRVQTAGGIDPVKRCVQQLRRQAVFRSSTEMRVPRGNAARRSVMNWVSTAVRSASPSHSEG